NQKGARISEHGKGRAIDVSAIVLKNGASMSVQKGWRDPAQGKVLKAMHRAACGPFGTVLGPNANKFHQDHFHFDTARYRSGSYCR
ncbi:MAG: extensin family protein, partial [Paracoccaceae bacterium]